MNLFENIQEPNRGQENRTLINKWSKSGLLEGLKGTEAATVSVLLENQAKQLIKEGNASSSGMGASGFEQWHGVALPLIRRIFAEISAKEFVSVQPMNLPSGLVFYLDFKYGTNKGPQGFAPGAKNQTGTLQGITNATNAAPSDGLYGAGRFGYSTDANVATGVAITTGSGAGTLSPSDVYFDGNFTASLSNYKKVTYALPANADPLAVRSFVPVSGSTTLTAGTQYYPAFTTYANGSASFIVLASALVGTFGGATNTAAVSYSIQPTNDARSDFETAANRANDTSSLSLDPDLNIPEIELQMRSIPVTAKTRKLKASWTPEFAQDLNAYHSVDAEAELTAMLSEYVSMEIDLEILDMLISSAATTEYWSAKVGQEWTGSTFAQSQFNGQAYIQGTWYATLGTKLQKVSNQIHAKTLRGGANFLVCSPDVSTILESIPGYAADGDGTKVKYAMGVQKVGALTSRYTVYKNPYMQENTVLMGFRGSQFLETGAVYAPYIPLMLTPLVYDPANFIPRRGVMTRYAKIVTRPEFYGKVYVADLNTL